MAIHPKVRAYLDERGVEYEVTAHERAYSTIEEARVLGVDADEVVKNLVVRAGSDRYFVLLPGAHRLDMKRLREMLGKHARLETEEEMAADFAEFDVGAVPPFGQLFGCRVVVDRGLLAHDTVVFLAGTHTDSVRMRTADFVNLLNADFADLASQAE